MLCVCVRGGGDKKGSLEEMAESASYCTVGDECKVVRGSQRIKCPVLDFHSPEQQNYGNS